MAFKKAQFGSKNPTGDKAFNQITQNVFGPDAAGKSPKTAKPAGQKAGGKPMGKGKPSYDCATNTFRNQGDDNGSN